MDEQDLYSMWLTYIIFHCFPKTNNPHGLEIFFFPLSPPPHHLQSSGRCHHDNQNRKPWNLPSYFFAMDT